jgi:hypothetical protein
VTQAEPTGDGSAREIPAGRLASFEEEPTPPALSLPPRPHRRSEPANLQVPPSVEAATTRPAGQDAPAGSAGHAIPPAMHRVLGPMRASNVHIPVTLIDEVNDTKRTTRMSNGDIIITAIEQTYEQLKERIRPRPTAGGVLFGRRVSRPPRTPATEPVTPLNFRMSVEDYEVLDRLVDELGATSRSHLITVALSTYYLRLPPN